MLGHASFDLFKDNFIKEFYYFFGNSGNKCCFYRQLWFGKEALRRKGKVFYPF